VRGELRVGSAAPGLYANDVAVGVIVLVGARVKVAGTRVALGVMLGVGDEVIGVGICGVLVGVAVAHAVRKKIKTKKDRFI
jgi:hypothetical protein